MFGWACSGDHRTGKHHHHVRKFCLTFVYSSHDGCLSKNRKPCFCFFLICQTDLLNTFQICGSLCRVVYVYFHIKKWYFCVVLCCVERRRVKECWLLCAMIIEKMKREFGFFLLWNIKELMWVGGRRRRSEFWCGLGLWKSKNKGKEMKDRSRWWWWPFVLWSSHVPNYFFFVFVFFIS